MPIGQLLGSLLNPGQSSGGGSTGGSTGGTSGSGTANLLGGLLTPLLPGVGTTVDSVVDTITGLLNSTGTPNGGLLGNLLSNGLLGGGTTGSLSSVLGVGLLGDKGILTLDILGTKVAVLPENGGIVTIGEGGVLNTGGILDIGGLLGKGGLLNLTDLAGKNGILDLNGLLGEVLKLLGNERGVDPGDYTDPDGNIDPSKFEKVFMGTDRDDTFSLTVDASTYVDGKDGIDTVNFARSAADFTLTVGSNAVMLTDEDSLFYMQNVERVQFFEGKLYLDTGAGENAGVAYRLYQAAFDRTPDNGGVKFWVDQLDNKLSWKDAANGFVNSAEFKQTYGNLNTNQFVDQIYKNVLGRDGRSDETKFWVDYLNKGTGDRASVLVGFSESAENVELVGQSIDKGFTVA